MCKKCFLSTLDETNRFVSEVLENKNAYLSGVTRRDKRGKHTPALKIAQVKLDDVINHINRFPAYESHKSRTKSRYQNPAAKIPPDRFSLGQNPARTKSSQK